LSKIIMDTLEGLAIVIPLFVAGIVAVFLVAWAIADRPARWQIKHAVKEAIYFTLCASALMFGWFAFNILTGGSSLWPTLIAACVIALFFAL
jgi:ammonia channel protein AmtB